MVSELVVCHEPRHVILKSLDLRTQALMSNLHNPSHRGKQEGHMCHKSFSLRSFCFFQKLPILVLFYAEQIRFHHTITVMLCNYVMLCKRVLLWF